ncbi:MAG: hypothetical protein E7571_00595 [Ruminococcaceae bacterium]|nr:hypothetical protein [Oscillospiraceae bacterium]
MEFQIAKPHSYMSFGAVFYSFPNIDEEERINKELREKCMNRANKEFKNNPTILEQIKTELEEIELSCCAIDILIIEEIAKLSKEMGYPVSLRGEACGLIIMYLLGIFNHNPLDYENAIVSSNIALIGMLFHNRTRFEMRIAEPVRAKIQQRLDKIFNCNKKIESDRRAFGMIGVISDDKSEMIGMLSKRTGRSFLNININDEQLLLSVFNMVGKDRLKWEQNVFIPQTIYDLAKLNSFSCCMNKAALTVDNFKKLKEYVCTEGMFKELVEKGYTMNDAYINTNSIYSSKNKEARIQDFRRNKVSEELITSHLLFHDVFHELSCVASVTQDVQLEFYKKYYHEEYENVINEIE